MKKRPRNGWAAALLALAMLLTCFPSAALADYAQLPEISRVGVAALSDSVPADETAPEEATAALLDGAVSVGTWAALKEAMQTGGDIVLTADVKDNTTKAPDTDNGYLLVPDGVTVTLDLAGHAVDRAMGNVKGDFEKGVVIWVKNNASLTIKDSSGNDSGKITGGYSGWAGGVLVDHGTLVLDSGSITGNRSDEFGLGVRMDGGSFTMNGGKVSDNIGGRGEGVYLRNEATFTMNGGSITGNKTETVGGGVAVDNGCSFTMNDGEISGNTAARDGGGVWTGGATFMMNGGKISGNTAGSGGGVSAGGTFVMSGGEISGNTATEDGGGVWLNYANFTLNGGKISNNTATRNGGGVYCYNNTQIIMSGGEISGNRATGEQNPDDENIGHGGGVYCHQVLTMSGGEISGNTTARNGGGVYYDVQEGYEDIESAMNISGTAAIKGNAARDGGGVYMNKDFSDSFRFVMDGGEISGNKATENGGGVYAIHNRTNGEQYPFPMLLSGGAIKNNQAKNGGGVYNAGNYLNVNVSELSNDDPKVTLTVTGGEISGNKAMENGGGVFCAGYNAGYRGGSNYDSAAFAMSGGRVADNSAVNGGGAYYEAGGIVLNGGAISENTVTDNGGGVFVISDDFTVSGSASVTGNRRGNAENNVYLQGENLIHLGGALDGASVAFSVDNPEQRGIFTDAYKSGGNTQNPGPAFPSDNDLYIADFSANGNEAELFRTIRKQDITLLDANGQAVTNSTYVYDGTAKTPAVKATWSGETLTENTDYTVSYADNVNASNAAAVTITGKGAYRGAVTVNFHINKAPITPTVSLAGWTYGQSAKTPAVTGNPGNGAVTYSYAPKGGAFSSSVPTNAGTYTVKAAVAESDNYQSGEASAEFTIAKANITPSVSVVGWAFGANPNAPSITGNPGNGAVTYSYAPKGMDYFSATTPTAVGAYTVKAVIAESANYNGGETSSEFTIEPLAVKKVTPSGGNVVAQVACGLSDASVYCAAYDNSGKMLAVKVKTVTGAETYDFAFDGVSFDYAKVFLLDADLSPLCEAGHS